MHAYIQAPTHTATGIQAVIQTVRQASVHTGIHTYIQAYIQAGMHIPYIQIQASIQTDRSV